MLATASTLLPMLLGLAQTPAAAPPAVAKPVQRGLQRATEDVQAVGRNLFAGNHAFAGSVAILVCPGLAQPPLEAVAYRGCNQDSLRLLRLGDHCVLTAGDRQLERRKDGPWTVPQGDAPDCPLRPSALAAHLATATITACEPTAEGGRPAMRVHAVWQGQTAAALVEETWVPHAKWRQMLERLPKMVQDDKDSRCVVDATLAYDPAMKQLYSASLRVAMTIPSSKPLTLPDTEAPPLPEGLPPLANEMMFQFLFQVAMLPAAQEPMPQLDAALRAKLGLPAR